MRRSRRDGQNGGVMPNRSSATRSRWIGGSVVGVVALAVLRRVRPGRVGGRPPEHAGAVDHRKSHRGNRADGRPRDVDGYGHHVPLCLAALRHEWGQLHADRRCDRHQVHAHDCRPRGDDPIRGHGLGQLGRGTATSSPTAAITTANGMPANSSPPTITGAATVGTTLASTTGSWVGDQPITYSYQWLRCDPSGNSCAPLSGAISSSYRLAQQQVGFTVRVKVIGENSRGNGSAISTQTAVVQDASGGGIINLPNGGKSVDVVDVPAGERLIVHKVQFSPNPVRSRSSAITVTVTVKDTRGYYVRNAFVFIRSTPILTATPTDAQTSRTAGSSTRSRLVRTSRSRPGTACSSSSRPIARATRRSPASPARGSYRSRPRAARRRSSLQVTAKAVTCRCARAVRHGRDPLLAEPQRLLVPSRIASILSGKLRQSSFAAWM